MSPRRLMVMAFALFVAIGWLGGALGPALPDLADQTGGDLAALGGLVTAAFIGTMTAQIVAGPLNDRLGQRPVILVGAALLGLGTLGILFSHSLAATLIIGFMYGFGFGAVDISTNLLIAHRFAQRSVPMLNLLHTFYGVGSVVSPAVAGLTLALWDSALPAFGLGFVAVLIPLPLVWRLDNVPLPTQQVSAARGDGFSYRVPLLWALGFLLLLFVGLEAGMGAWTTAYVDRTTTLGKEVGALITSGYWLALTVGRVLGALYSARFTPQTVLWACLAGMLGGSALLAVGHGSAALTVLAVLVLGLWSGPPYPTIVAITTATFPNGPGKATSVVVAMASLGAATLPWMQGVLLDRVSALAMALLFVAEALAMVLVMVAVQARSPRRAVAPAD
ncbi:MAG: MFS transporter [Chloroflexota bacterium]